MTKPSEIYPPTIMALIFVVGATSFAWLAVSTNSIGPAGIAGAFLLVAGLFVSLIGAMAKRLDALAQLGNPIPQDAVDRRWIVEIEKAVNEGTAFYGYGGMPEDPLTVTERQTREQAQRSKIQNLFYAAKNARGVRLPQRVTMRED
jgi:hypothetical protein